MLNAYRPVESVRENGKNTRRVLLRLGEVGELESSRQLDRIIAAPRSHTEWHWIAGDELRLVERHLNPVKNRAAVTTQEVPRRLVPMTS